MSLRVGFASVMRKIASYLTKNRSETGRKIAQSTHENEYIKPEKTFCGNSKQFLRITTGCPLQEECLRRMFLKKTAEKLCGNGEKVYLCNAFTTEETGA